jgi:hypothetical protein
MPVESTEKSPPTQPPRGAESGFSHEAQSTWAPRTNYFKLGAVCNETYNQSLATQYDNIGQYAVNGIGNGVGHILAGFELAGSIVADAASVVTADLQIGYEKLTYPALAEANSDALAQHLRQLGTKYESALHPLKQGYESMERDFADIGAQSNSENKAYARLLTDPARNIADAVDKFTGQTPGAQVEGITDQATQFGMFGLAEKALTGIASLSAASFSAKYQELLTKMDAELSRIRTSGPVQELQPVGAPSTWTPKDDSSVSEDRFLAMSNDGYRGDHDPYAPINSVTGKAKSYIDESGDLTPPDPAGLFKGKPVDVVQHLCGSFYKHHKQFSPYTSFSETGEIIEKYGERYKITVDLKALEKAMLREK